MSIGFVRLTRREIFIMKSLILPSFLSILNTSRRKNNQMSGFKNKAWDSTFMYPKDMMRTGKILLGNFIDDGVDIHACADGCEYDEFSFCPGVIFQFVFAQQVQQCGHGGHGAVAQPGYAHGHDIGGDVLHLVQSEQALQDGFIHLLIRLVDEHLVHILDG